MNVIDREGRVDVINRDRRSVRLELGEWEDVGAPHPPDASVTAFAAKGWRRLAVEEVRVPESVSAAVVDTETGERQFVERVGESQSVSAGETVVLRAGIVVVARPESDGSLTRTAESAVLTFDGDGEQTLVTLGFRSPRGDLPDAVSIERSPRGVARGLSTLACAIQPSRPGSPDRTWPHVRRVPPRLALDGTGVDPDRIDTPDLDTEIVVPADDTLRWLYPTTGLLHYLGATATVADDATDARLRAGNEWWTLGTTPEETDDTATRWLRRVFGLDCHARAASEFGTRLDGHEVLGDALGVDAETLYEESLPTRVQRYLAVDDDSAAVIDDHLPEWHLGVHVAPEPRRAWSLSHLLRQLPDVYLPDAAELTTLGERARWSERQRVRGSDSRRDPNRVVVVPDDSRAHTVGWNAPGRPVGAFDVCGEAPSPRRLTDAPLDVTVVRCSPDYSDDDVLGTWSERGSELALDVTGIVSPGVERLRETIAADADLLHVIGHSDAHGVECSNGNLTVGDVSQCGADAVMLNACESYELGERLVESGADAVAVTTGTVPDETAQTVGANWAGLVSLGWCIERALDAARSVVDPEAYLTLGDGTHVVTRAESPTPPLVTVDDESVTIDHLAPRHAGARVIDTLASEPHLPARHTYSATTEQKQRVSDIHRNPVRTDGELVWNWSPE